MIITSGKFKGRKITAPDESITRPTLSKVRMSVFNTLQSLINFYGSSFLDMYAGSGIMGLEALSRGFTQVVAIEKNPKAASVIKSNLKSLKILPSHIVAGTDGFHVERNWSKSPSPLEAGEAGFHVEQFWTITPSPLEGEGWGEGYRLLVCDSLKAKLTEKFDVIYIDPPYFSGIYEESLKAIKDIAGGIVILEHVTDVDFQGFEVVKQKKYGDKFITFLR